MSDKEKVIKGLQIERECVSRDCDRDCGKCDLVQDRDWLLSVYDDAIALLKEREPILPSWRQGKAYCGECGKRLPRKSADREINYCSDCGQEVKWK